MSYLRVIQETSFSRTMNPLTRGTDEDDSRAPLFCPKSAGQPRKGGNYGRHRFPRTPTEQSLTTASLSRKEGSSGGEASDHYESEPASKHVACIGSAAKRAELPSPRALALIKLAASQSGEPLAHFPRSHVPTPGRVGWRGERRRRWRCPAVPRQPPSSCPRGRRRTPTGP